MTIAFILCVTILYTYNFQVFTELIIYLFNCSGLDMYYWNDELNSASNIPYLCVHGNEINRYDVWVPYMAYIGETNLIVTISAVNALKRA